MVVAVVTWQGLIGGGRLLTLQEVAREVVEARRGQQQQLREGGGGGGQGLMLPLSEGFRGRQVFSHVLEGSAGEGGVFLVTALCMKKLAASWGAYMAEIL